MKKGICARCKEFRYVNQHHIYPKEFFGTKDNTETVQLCLDCHVEIHEILPSKKQPISFYKELTMKFIGILFILLIVSIGLMKVL